MRTDIKKLRQSTEEFAKKMGLSQEEYEKRYEMANREIKTRDMDESVEEFYTLKRVQLSLKARAAGGSQTFEGFFIAKEPAFDFVRKAREEMTEYVRDEGQRIAKKVGLCDKDLNPTTFFVDAKTNTPVVNYTQEDEEAGIIKRIPPLSRVELSQQVENLGMQEAQQRGLADNKGHFIYQKPEFKKGKVMPLHDYSSNAYGFFSLPGDDTPKLTKVVIRGHLALEELPLFENIEFQSKLNKRQSSPDFYQTSINKIPPSSGDTIDYWDYAKNIRETLGHRFLGSLQDIPQFVKDNPGFGEWCAVEADILTVGAISEYDSVAVSITDETMNSIQSESNDFTFWARKKLAMGLDDMINDAFIVLSPYESKKDKKITGNIIGYWIDPLLRPVTTGIADINEEEIAEPWGQDSQ